jgi:hypothetical protein
VEVPTVAEPVPVPVLVKYAYAPTAEMATARVARRVTTPFLLLRKFLMI